LEALVRAGYEMVGVLTQPDRPKGRGRQIASSPVKTRALAHGISVSQPQTLKDEASRAEMASWRPDVLVVVAYGLILPRAALDIPRLGCLNIHASLLPRWRGAAPIQRSILAGDATTGVTIMLMDVGLDTGPMLLRRETAIEPGDTGGSLHDRLSMLGAAAILEAIQGLAAGTLQPVPQPSEGVTYAAKIEKAEALIDWKRPAVEIERQVRAFNPWPVAETRLDGEQLRIFAASASLSQRIDAEPGMIVAVQDDGLWVQCGQGQLALQQLQRPGRRAVPAADFARGGAQLAGRRLG
jgi:methionyl-tRNA formyltransferase